MPQKLGWSPNIDAKERGHFNLGVLAAGTVSVYIDANAIDRLDFQIIWGGNLTAATKVLASNSFIPDPQDSQVSGARAPLRLGAFTDITSRVSKTTDPAGAAGNQDVDVGAVSQGFIRLDITQSAGSGQVDVYVSGKTIGAY